MIPFSPEVLFALFEEYNLAIWPAQIAAYVLGLIVLGLVFRPSLSGSRVVGAILAIFWLGNGIAYHWQHFTPINFAAPVFAALFLVQALILWWRFTVQGDLTFEFRRDIASAAGVTFMIFAMVIYPLLGMASGHSWPQAAMFGVAPSPMVVFTLGTLLLATPKVPIIPIVVPLLWALIGGCAAWFLDIPEDVSLPLAGLAAVLLLVRKNRRAS